MHWCCPWPKISERLGRRLHVEAGRVAGTPPRRGWPIPRAAGRPDRHARCCPPISTSCADAAAEHVGRVVEAQRLRERPRRLRGIGEQVRRAGRDRARRGRACRRRRARSCPNPSPSGCAARRRSARRQRLAVDARCEQLGQEPDSHVRDRRRQSETSSCSEVNTAIVAAWFASDVPRCPGSRRNDAEMSRRSWSASAERHARLRRREPARDDVGVVAERVEARRRRPAAASSTSRAIAARRSPSRSAASRVYDGAKTRRRSRCSGGSSSGKVRFVAGSPSRICNGIWPRRTEKLVLSEQTRHTASKLASAHASYRSR